jgi:Fe-Mn family superoxide dismutase
MFHLNDFPLPFRETDLVPYMSVETVQFHYGKHLATYIANLNKLIADTKYADMDLREIIINSARDENAQKIFNNAAQIFNHEFFFNCLGRGGNTMVPDLISDAFGGAAEFKEKFKAIANSVFGSGWVWLTHDNANGFEIIATKNADTPIAHGIKPVLTLDLWEHAYYLDFQNRRADFIDTFLESLIDWKFVVSNMNI